MTTTRDEDDDMTPFLTITNIDGVPYFNVSGYGGLSHGHVFPATADGLKSLGRWMATTYPKAGGYACSSSIDFPGEEGVSIDTDTIHRLIAEGVEAATDRRPRPTYEGMRDTLTDLRGWLEILAGNVAGPSGHGVTDNCRGAADAARALADMLQGAAEGRGESCLSFPGWDDAEDDATYWKRGGRV